MKGEIILGTGIAINWLFNTMEKTGLPPLICPEPRILILGSLPSDMSIQRQEYYGNPRNLFWKIISGVYMEELPDSYEDKKTLLARHGIVLWDVYASAMREGSLDANIRGGEFNDLAAFLAKHNGIEIVATNGGEARKSLKRYVRQRGHISDGDVSIMHFRSTSPMVRTSGWTIDMLIRQWSELKNQKI